MIVVVGGHARKIGKSAVVSALIRALPQARWTAVKISRHNHPAVTVHEETSPGATDSGRYLQAGAVRSFWIEVDRHRFEQALPALHRILASGPNSIVESTSIVRWLQPDLYLFLVDPSVADWKPSSRECLDRASAFLIVDHPAGREVSLPSGPPHFRLKPADYHSSQLVDFVAARLAQCASGMAISSVNIPPGPE